MTCVNTTSTYAPPLSDTLKYSFPEEETADIDCSEILKCDFVSEPIREDIPYDATSSPPL